MAEKQFNAGVNSESIRSNVSIREKASSGVRIKTKGRNYGCKNYWKAIYRRKTIY